MKGLYRYLNIFDKIPNFQIYSNFSGLHGKQQEMQQDIYKWR